MSLFIAMAVLSCTLLLWFVSPRAVCFVVYALSGWFAYEEALRGSAVGVLTAVLQATVFWLLTACTRTSIGQGASRGDRAI
jgi:hypothetical protein